MLWCLILHFVFCCLVCPIFSYFFTFCFDLLEFALLDVHTFLLFVLLCSDFFILSCFACVTFIRLFFNFSFLFCFVSVTHLFSEINYMKTSVISTTISPALTIYTWQIISRPCNNSLCNLITILLSTDRFFPPSIFFSSLFIFWHPLFDHLLEQL